MSYNYSSTYKTMKLSEIYKGININLIELFMKKTTDYTDFLKNDFFDLVENCKMRNDMKNKFLQKYIYYFLKSHKILLDYMKFESYEFSDIITVPIIPMLEQYRLVYSIDRCIQKIDNNYKKECINNIIINNDNNTIKKINRLYDNILYIFNTIIHTDLLAVPEICHYSYYSNDYKYSNYDINNYKKNNSKKIIII